MTAQTLAAGYRRFILGRMVILGGLGLAVVLAFALDVATGPSGIRLAELLKSADDPALAVILWDIRLPQATMAVLVGAALALAGAEMQTTLNNSLASPFTLGLTNAATLGAACAIVFDLALPGLPVLWSVPALAFCFALGATLLVNVLARSQGAGADTVVLFGIAMVFVMNALLWLVQYVASADAVQQIVFWTMGSLTRSSWEKVALVGLVLALSLPLSLRQVWAMTTLRGGEDHARSFGIGVERLRLVVLVRVSLLAAAAVSFVGTIGFIGLVGPHLARLVVGEDHRFYLPGAALAGALVMSLASTASKSLVPGLVLPVGIVTALVGIPLFMALLLGQRRRS
ncbi:iron ABC transporter permease [Magnetospirillum sp. 64-120]|uniref:FecCD family ABC transporter permease n=1 Tax=Magnetospirillum sp. 64-120 TaxID=1895778 RepID=UPI0009272A37|nr:iron ABC transporter permease [Magnetospirillum sp. 64-120]OJX75167.1 MAG: iron ABC transporter permease [Magnetospirillum sp. 64-120]